MRDVVNLNGRMRASGSDKLHSLFQKFIKTISELFIVVSCVYCPIENDRGGVNQ